MLSSSWIWRRSAQASRPTGWSPYAVRSFWRASFASDFFPDWRSSFAFERAASPVFEISASTFAASSTIAFGRLTCLISWIARSAA